MSAKKNIIKDLRQEIRDLENEIKGQCRHINYREKQFLRVQAGHKRELSLINTYTNNIASSLKYRFNKDLTWLELCDDPDSKIQIIKRAVSELYDIAKPPRDNDD